ncbi:MAG: hypothetical protein OXD30_06425 [Bryobacterales bacterium]|nr:hypothetical protein [Bryobacterales bacterium]
MSRFSPTRRKPVNATTFGAQAPALCEHFSIALTSLASDCGMTAAA